MKKIINLIKSTVLALSVGIFCLSVYAKTPITATIIYSSNQCGYVQEAIKEVGYNELRNIFNHYNQFALPALKIPNIDFDENMLVLVASGQKSTLGYSVEPIYKNNQLLASLDNSVLTLPIKLIVPNNQNLQSQIISSPCMLLKTDRVAYQEIVLE